MRQGADYNANNYGDDINNSYKNDDDLNDDNSNNNDNKFVI